MVTVKSEHCVTCARPWNMGSTDGLSNSPRRSPPLTVSRALKEHCNIPFDAFFLATYTKDGTLTYFSGPSRMPEEQINQVFTRAKFLRFIRQASRRDGVSEGYEEECNGQIHPSMPNRASLDNHWTTGPGRRKRPRKAVSMRRQLDDEAAPVVTSIKKPLVIGDSKAVMDFYDRSFRWIQQTACKELGKAFVKLICPKKSAQYQYNKGEVTAPDWWPHWAHNNKLVRHKEPDHLLKEERIVLLKQILKLVVDPTIRPPSMRNLGPVSVAQLEVAAVESLAAFFRDPKKPKNDRKRPILKELFRVAKMEERYKRNEIDGTTQTMIDADDMIRMNDWFDFDEERASDEWDAAHREDMGIPADAIPLSPSISPVPQALAAQFQPSTGFQDLPHRPNVYGAPAMLPTDISAAEQYSYPTATMHLPNILTGLSHQPHEHHPHSPQQHDASRRSSLFMANNEFNTPPPSAMYPTTHWAQSPQSQGPTTPNLIAASTPDVPASSPAMSTSPIFAYPHSAIPMQHELSQQGHSQPPNDFSASSPVSMMHQQQVQPQYHPYQQQQQYQPHQHQQAHSPLQQQQQMYGQQPQHHQAVMFGAGNIQLSM
ncbi:uncharacterized protein C8A04DRAFT_9838 [Dichotomopilus funicola]|uniref:Subtelomeric hrmA-associated cluster protein AFUB-079030/YDR124W-like helical bundle domain-containing protein n=1 Tax=Dichotomopilus funicola TaxID=1934379 RepID=A0AAN6V7H6_9PEZI|nr:hypothetical protein C8A04DRAFT_9838 [Dichotomopilus funicola]